MLAKQGVPATGADAAAVEALLGVTVLREWPDVATAVLMEDLEAGDRWALVRAGNIDDNTDFLALHLRALLHRPDLRQSTLEFLLLLSAQASGFETGALYDSPAHRHLAAALATGEVPHDEVEEAIRRLAETGRLPEAAGPRLFDPLRHSARRYAELVASVREGKGLFATLARTFDPDEKRFEAFFTSDDEAFARSVAADLLHEPEERGEFCRRLAQIAYVEAGRSLEERHRAEERLVLLGNAGAQRLLRDPERTLADWLDPYRMMGAERDMILTIVAMEDLRSGGAAARILRGALQNPLFQEQALDLMIEVTFRNPPGMMEEQLLEAVASGEMGERNAALAYLKQEAEDTLGPTMAAGFMAHVENRLETFTPGAGSLPFSLLPPDRKRVVPFLASTLENRVQRSLDLLAHRLGAEIPYGLRDAVLHLFGDAEAEEVLPRYRGCIDPEPLLETLRSGFPGDREVVRQLACDLVVLNEVIQRKDRADRECLREHLPFLLLLRVLALHPDLKGIVRSGTQVPRPATREWLAFLTHQKYESLKRDLELSGRLWNSVPAQIRDWAYQRMRETFTSPEIDPLLGFLGDEQETVRNQAAEIVRSERERHLPHLLRMLHNPDAPIRLGALAALAGTEDPEVRWEIAQRLDDREGEVSRAAAKALNGLERTLLHEMDRRIVKLVGKQLEKLPPGEIDGGILRDGLDKLLKVRDLDALEVDRYRCAAHLLSRSPNWDARAVAYRAAAGSGSRLTKEQKAAALDHLTARAIYDLYIEQGGVAAAHRLVQTHLPFEGRLVTLLGLIDEFRTRLEENKTTLRLGNSQYDVYSGAAAPETLGGGYAFRVLRSPVRPGASFMEQASVQEAIRSIYLKFSEMAPSMQELEQNILVAGAFISGQPIEEVWKLHTASAWIAAEPWDRAALTVILVYLRKHPGKLAAFLSEIYLGTPPE